VEAQRNTFLVHLQEGYTVEYHLKYLKETDQFDAALAKDWNYTLNLNDHIWLDHIPSDPGVLDMFCDVEGKLKRVVTLCLVYCLNSLSHADFS
jgi:hypothetical protein